MWQNFNNVWVFFVASKSSFVAFKSSLSFLFSTSMHIWNFSCLFFEWMCVWYNLFSLGNMRGELILAVISWQEADMLFLSDNYLYFRLLSLFLSLRLCLHYIIIFSVFKSPHIDVPDFYHHWSYLPWLQSWFS